jgi:creatinine amidohydrolase
MNSDPLGHTLLAERIASVAEHIAALGASFPVRDRRHPAPRRVVATGIGSSEAHARYLVWLLNRYTPVPAEFAPLGSFVDAPAKSFADCTLAVFSQGISSNARIALERQAEFAHLVLFTASTPAGLRASGKPDRADLLDRLLLGGAETVPFPIEDEYAILIRVIGPALGFLAARLWAGGLPGAALAGRSETVAAAAAAAYRAGLDAGRKWSEAFSGDDFHNGFVMPVSPAISEYAQNLSCKFVEGVFRPAPAVMDLLQFAHGPFQQLAAAPRPVVVLHRANEIERDLLRRIQEMCAAIPLKCVATEEGLMSPDDLLVFETEGLFWPSIYEAIVKLGADQVRWPGKGQDGPLYTYTGRR